MVQVADVRLRPTRLAETRLAFAVCFAHFVSHYYILLLAPLFVFIRADYGVTYTELGLALTAFNVISTVLQTPAGFLVDRVNARIVLIAGLLTSAGAFTVAALIHSFWVFVAMYAVAGLGNTVYHPADYSLLARHIPAERAGRVFSYHTFAGMAGNAAAPATLLYLQAVIGWRGAFLSAAALGLLAAFILLWTADPAGAAIAPATARRDKASAPNQGWRLLLSTPILMNLAFFILLSVSGGGLYNYLVVTLGALYGTPVAIANTALTGLLTMSAVGVLAGGVLTGWTTRHSLVASFGLLTSGTICVLVGSIDFPALLLVLLISGVGFCNGLTMPSRDMIVRSVTPHGAYGRVFGFVTTGFNIAGIVSPIIFGQLLDRGHPREIFYFMAACTILGILTVVYSTSRRAETSAAAAG